MKKINLNYVGVLALILFALFSRIIPHMPNFTPVGAIALFGGAYLNNKYHAFLVPIISLWVSDIIINNFLLSLYSNFIWFYSGFIWQYSSFLLITLIGIKFLKRKSLKNIFLTTFCSSLLFFLITNFGVWFSGSLYPKTLNGLLICYTAGLPFFKGTILGFAFYSTLLFGIFESLKYKKVIDYPINTHE